MFHASFLLAILLKECYCAVPIFSGLPTEKSVGELETDARIIYVISASDPDGNAFSCTISSMAPTWGPFEVTKDTLLDKFVVETLLSGTQVFDVANTTQFVITIKCDDGTGTGPTADLTVKVVANDLLKFSNLPVSTTSKDASTTGAGTTLYTVVATSALNTLLTFTRYTGSSDFSLDSSTGVVTNNDHLNRQVSTPIDLWIKVTDGTIEALDLLRINLANLNSVPYFTNMPSPQTENIAEDIASGTLLYTLTSQDNDPGATLVYSMNVDPVTETSKFSFSTNTLELRLASGQNFDYETRTFYNLTFTVDDSMASTTSILYIYIQNAFEACYFDQSLYHVSAAEGAIGAGGMDPSFIVKDYDGTSTYSLSFLNFNNSNRFSIHSSTGVITYAVDYDIDNNAMPALVYLTVICTDTTSQTGTSQVGITITDINDNAPSFAISSSLLTVNQYTSPGTLIGNILPTDADSGTNAEFTCSGTSAISDATTYYRVGTDCGVYLISSPSGTLSYGTMYTMTITAVDKGTPALTGVSTVDILYKELTTTTVTTTTTTANPYNLWDDPGAVAGIAMAIIFGTILSAILLYFLICCCYLGYCCGPDPFDFCNCCKNNNCCEPRHKQSRVITPQEYR